MGAAIRGNATAMCPQQLQKMCRKAIFCDPASRRN